MTHQGSATARARILQRIQAALAERAGEEHPGAFGSWTSAINPNQTSVLDMFRSVFEAAGGEVARVSGAGEARSWLEARWPRTAQARGPRAELFLEAGDGDAPSRPSLRPGEAPHPSEAAVGVTLARGAVAETGTLLLGSEDGRAVQLLPPEHVVLVAVEGLVPTLAHALSALQGHLPPALGLHSGPSKSADIGQILVQGVHGPGRVVALLVDLTPGGVEASLDSNGPGPTDASGSPME